MVRWLPMLALVHWSAVASASLVMPGSGADQQLPPLEIASPSSAKWRRALLAAQAPIAEEANVENVGQYNDENGAEADDCNLQQENMDLCVCPYSAGC